MTLCIHVSENDSGNCYLQCSKGYKYKIIKARVMILTLCILSYRGRFIAQFSARNTSQIHREYLIFSVQDRFLFQRMNTKSSVYFHEWLRHE